MFPFVSEISIHKMASGLQCICLLLVWLIPFCKLNHRGFSWSVSFLPVFECCPNCRILIVVAFYVNSGLIYICDDYIGA